MLLRVSEFQHVSIVGHSGLSRLPLRSFAFDFRGASECVDTACASGLSALASAQSELLQGAEGAVAIGVLISLGACCRFAAKHSSFLFTFVARPPSIYLDFVCGSM